MELVIDKGILSYKDTTISTNIKLIENSIIAVPKFNVNTFKSFEFNFSTKITQAKVMELKRAMDFASDTSKFYISNEDGKIFITFGDKQVSYSDDIKVVLSDSFDGELTQNIYDISILKLTTRFNNDMLLKIGTNGALCIQLIQPNSELNYITTQLKK